MEKLEKFGDLYRKYEFEEKDLCNKPLWHYTSAEGLLGIIRNEEDEHNKMHFWFTRSDCLNDASEGIHVLDLYNEICVELFKQKQISEKFFNHIKDVEMDLGLFINYPIPPDEDCFHASVLDYAECDAYICCFSLKEDSLDMWRFYSKGNGGYGLKCWPALFEKQIQFEYSDFNKDELFSKICAYEVIYDDKKKRQILKNIILDAYTVYEVDSSTDNEKTKEVQSFIRYILKILQFQFKHECYASEQEYRYVFYRPRKKPEKLQNELPEVKYRVQNGVVVPYIDIVVEKVTYALDEVLISPYVESKYARNTTKDYLTQCGFECNVKVSKLPVQK